MTRAEILRRYRVTDGRITSPGKFEGEPIYAPHFCDFMSEGEELAFSTDGAGEYATLVEVSSVDRREFPEIPPGSRYIFIRELDSSFIYARAVTTNEAEDIRRDYAAQEREWSEEDGND